MRRLVAMTQIAARQSVKPPKAVARVRQPSIRNVRSRARPTKHAMGWNMMLKRATQITEMAANSIAMTRNPCTKNAFCGESLLVSIAINPFRLAS